MPDKKYKILFLLIFLSFMMFSTVNSQNSDSLYYLNLDAGLGVGIHLSDLEDDYYVLDEKSYSIVGTNNQKQFRLGDKLQVKLKSVNEEKREIDFTLS